MIDTPTEHLAGKWSFWLGPQQVLVDLHQQLRQGSKADLLRK